MEDFLIALLTIGALFLCCCYPFYSLFRYYGDAYKQIKSGVKTVYEEGKDVVGAAVQTVKNPSQAAYTALPHTDNIEGTINPTFEVEAPS